MSTTPNNESTGAPHSDTTEEQNPPTPSEALEVVLNWLRHYWDAPRYKSKWTEIVMVILTVLIAIAAIGSAVIF